MKKKFDLIIVGAGPAGLLATRAAAENGLDVALLERKENISQVARSCGQSLVSMNEYYLGELVHYNAKDKRICFPATGFSLAYHGPIKAMHSWQFFSPELNKIQFGFDEDESKKKGIHPISMVFDKENLLEGLLEQIKSSHVNVFGGTEVTDIRLEANDIVIQAGEKTFRTTYAIAADGTNSKVVQRLGFNQERKHIGTLYVKSCFIKGFHAPDNSACIVGFAFMDAGPVMMFLFPRPDGIHWNVVFLTLEKKVDLNIAAEHLMKNSNYSPWFKDSEVLREFAAIEHIYTPILKPFKNNVLVIGDAAACQELENTGAMITGWKAGHTIAAACKDAELGFEEGAIAQYFDWWINTYIKKYDYEDYIKCFAIPYIFSNAEIIDYVFSQVKDPLPPCFNAYNAVHLLGQVMQGVMPKIMSERPDIIPQLMKMGLPSSEVLASTLND
jgi:digeranylgeranylglycerophospholipid reductase